MSKWGSGIGLSTAGETGDEIRWLESHPRADAWWLPPKIEPARGGTWSTCRCRGFFEEVDQGTAHLMVGSSAGDEVVTGKFFRQQRGVLMAVKGFEAFCDEGGVVRKGNIAKPYPEPSMALIRCRKKDNIIGGNNSL